MLTRTLHPQNYREHLSFEAGTDYDSPVFVTFRLAGPRERKNLMMPIKTILVPLDFSEPSKKALDCALGMAMRIQAKLFVLHIVPEAIDAGETVDRSAIEAQQRARTAEEIEALIPAQKAKHVDLQVIVRTGRVDEDLLAVVAERSVDLVVMGSHGRRAFRRWFMGSVTEHMLRRLPVPVLTISHIEEDRYPFGGGVASFNRILFATDLGDSSAAGMRYAVELARSFSSELTVMTVVEYLNLSYEAVSYAEGERTRRIQQSQKELDAFIGREKPQGINVNTVVADGKPYEQILSTARKLKADCIVLTLQSRSLLERAFLGSTAERVVRLAPIPVLSIPFATRSSDPEYSPS
jgi:nucleotide-binding universal stress UspA family protein